MAVEASVPGFSPDRVLSIEIPRAQKAAPQRIPVTTRILEHAPSA